jgi:hypothetical protein
MKNELEGAFPLSEVSGGKWWCELLPIKTISINWIKLKMNELLMIVMSNSKKE